MTDEELRVRASMENDLSRPLRDIRGDVDEVGDAVDRTNRKARSLTGRLGGLSSATSRLGTIARRTGGMLLRGLAYAAGIAGGAIAALGAYAIKSASDLGESANKSNVIFGRQARRMNRWSKSMANDFGIARGAALEYAATFGNITQVSGLSEKASAKMSRRLVGLAADMASFNNIGTDEALEKIRAGLVGEAEPLRTVGVLLSETRVAQEAYAAGIAKQGAELTDAQKVQARYNLILQDTAKQQGDFARTSTSLPNLVRRIQASFTDYSAVLGNDVLPAARSLAMWALDTMPDAFAALRSAIRPARDAITELGNIVESRAFKRASLGGKIRLAWDQIVAEPFEKWYETSGQRFLARAGSLLGKGLGKVARGAILAPLYILGGDDKAIEDAGVKIGVRFWRSFLNAFDPKDLAKRLASAVADVPKSIAPGGATPGESLLPWLGLGIFTKTGRGLMKGGLKKLGGLLKPGATAAAGGAARSGLFQTLALKAMYAKDALLGGAAGLAGAEVSGAAATGPIGVAAIAAGYAWAKAATAAQAAQDEAHESILAGIPTMNAYAAATEAGRHSTEDLARFLKIQVDVARDAGASTDELAWITDRAEWLMDRYGNSIKITTGNLKALGRVARDTGSITAANLAGRPGAPSGGDTTRSHARGGNIGRSLALHGVVESMTPGRRTITSAVRAWGPSGDHQRGSALDVTGPNQVAYAKNLRALGGFAESHGAGSGRHTHGVYPAGDTRRSRAKALIAASGSASGLLEPIQIGALVNVENLNGVQLAELEATVLRAYRKIQTDVMERTGGSS